MDESSKVEDKDELLEVEDILEDEMEGVKSVNILDTLRHKTKHLDIDDTGKMLPALADITPHQIPQAIAAFLSSYPGLQQMLPVMPRFISGKEIEYGFRTSKREEFAILGSGIYGQVILGYHIPTGEAVAIKFLKQGILADSVKSTIMEAALLEYTQSTGVVPKLYGLVVCQDNPDYELLAIVTSFEGDLVTKAAQDLDVLALDRSISDHESLAVFVQLVRGVKSFHEKDLVLSDLKTDNVLVVRKDGKLRLVLIDLGETKFRVRHVDYQVNPSKYDAFLNYYTQVAPESVYQKLLPPISDVYRIGKILLKYTSCRPWSALHDIAIKCRLSMQDRISVDELLEQLRALQQ